MTKAPKDYSKGKIYIIRSPHTDKVYIGSCIVQLSIRMGVHRAPSNSCRSKEIISAGNAYIELLENFPCSSIEELRQREGECQRANPLCCNRNIAGRTQKEYYIDNIDKIKQYYIDNVDTIKEKQKEYRTDNADKIKQYYLDNADTIKEKQKEYKIENVDKIKKYQKEYRTDNADILKEKKKEKHSCECCGNFTKSNKTQHMKSKKHLDFLSKKLK